MDFKNFNWRSGLFLLIYHAMLLITLPIYFFFFGLPSFGLILAVLILMLFIGISVTAGYHRLYAHKSYKTNKSIEFFLLLFGTLASEQSVLKWSSDHRQHHKFVDGDKDPYSIKKGFWYAHVLWIFEKSYPIDKNVVPDLFKNKLVMFQHKYYDLLWMLTNILVVSGFGFIFKDFFGAFVFGVLARIFLIHHLTWFINSLAHYWGAQTYSRELSAVDNYIISLLTFGEGYHNYHHTFASDYRNGVRWYHFDPTKWLVWSLSKIGLAKGLIKINKYTIKRKLVEEDRRLMLDNLKKKIDVHKAALEKKVNKLFERIISHIDSVNMIKEKFKQNMADKKKLAQLRLEMKIKKKVLRGDWRAWCGLVKEIIYFNPS